MVDFGFSGKHKLEGSSLFTLPSQNTLHLFLDYWRFHRRSIRSLGFIVSIVEKEELINEKSSWKNNCAVGRSRVDHLMLQSHNIEESARSERSF